MGSVEELSFVGGNGNTLSGLLHKPEGQAKGSILLAHCFSCTKDVVTMSRMSKGLADAGYAALRFDFTGLGSSGGDFAKTTVSGNVSDLTRATVALLELGYGPCGMIGHSLGGAAAILAAAKLKTVRSLVTIGAPSNVRHVTHLFGDRVDDMLRVARSESGRLDLSSGRIDLNKVVSDAVADETIPAKRRGIRLKPEPVSGEIAILGDYDWLRQVMGGLIVNAVKNSPDDTVITISITQQLHNVVVAIEDQGRGIDPDSLPFVFERFARAGGDRNQQVETESDGFGIGLNLARWVIEEHSGTISLGNNVDGPGVTVHVTLPVMSEPTDQGKTT